VTEREILDALRHVGLLKKPIAFMWKMRPRNTKNRRDDENTDDYAIRLHPDEEVGFYERRVAMSDPRIQSLAPEGLKVNINAKEPFFYGDSKATTTQQHAPSTRNDASSTSTNRVWLPKGGPSAGATHNTSQTQGYGKLETEIKELKKDLERLQAQHKQEMSQLENRMLDAIDKGKKELENDITQIITATAMRTAEEVTQRNLEGAIAAMRIERRDKQLQTIAHQIAQQVTDNLRRNQGSPGLTKQQPSKKARGFQGATPKEANDNEFRSPPHKNTVQPRTTEEQQLPSFSNTNIFDELLAEQMEFEEVHTDSGPEPHRRK
jgi:predicted transcriptional regulator